MSFGFKRDSNWRTSGPASMFPQLMYHIQVLARSTSPDMATVLHARPYDEGIEWMKTPTFLVVVLVERHCKSPSIAYKKNIFKRWFSFKNRPVLFQISSTRVIRSVNKTSWIFPAVKSKSHSRPSLRWLVSQIQVQKSTVVVVKYHMPARTYSR